MKDVPNHFGRQRGRIPNLVSCRWREDDQVADPLIVGIDRKVRFEHLVSIQVVPIEVRRDSSSGYEGVIFLLRVEVCAYAYNWSIW